MSNAKPVLMAVFYFILFVAVLYFRFGIRYRIRERNWNFSPLRRQPRDSWLPITKEQLYRTSIWPHIQKWIFAFVPIALLLWLMGFGGRMSIPATIGSILSIGVFLLVFCLPHILTHLKSFRRLDDIPDFDALFRSKEMQWLNGAWGYADKDWFIRVSLNHSAALRAADIDFSVPVRRYSLEWRVSGKTGGMHLTLWQLEFAGHDGKPIFACCEADQNIVNWIHQHGGSLAWDKGKEKKKVTAKTRTKKKRK